VRYTQDSGVRRVPGTDEYKVVTSIYLTAEERDLWGARKARLTLQPVPAATGDTPRAWLAEWEAREGQRVLEVIRATGGAGRYAQIAATLGISPARALDTCERLARLDPAQLRRLDHHTFEIITPEGGTP
jgi:hypothetical protein